MDEEVRWIVTASAEAAMHEAAQVLAGALCEAHRHREHPRLAISGGSAANCLPLLRGLLSGHAAPVDFDPVHGSSARTDRWRTIRLTWADERCVPFSSPDSNRGAAHRAGQLSTAHPCDLELALWEDRDETDGAPAAVRRFEHAFAEHFDSALDAVLLGMGPDGHVASLFPGHEVPAGLVAVIEDSPKPPPRRITLTKAALATASVTVLVACGKEKRDALRRLAAKDSALPATGAPGLVVVTDQQIGAPS